jgi:mRNA degradation ribonuclease J1/J2
MSWLKPQLLVPMHGELRHLKRQLEFAEGCGIPALGAGDGRRDAAPDAG